MLEKASPINSSETYESHMDGMAPIGNLPNQPVKNRSVESELSASTCNKKTLDQYLEIYATRLFNFLKIVIFILLLLAIAFNFIKIYTQQGIVILPFEINKNENFSGIAIADQLTAELIQIQNIHNTKYEEILKTDSSYYAPDFSSNQLIDSRKMIVPKTENLELSMADIGTVGTGSNSLSLGNLIIAFKNIFPSSKQVTTIRGSLQRSDSTIVLIALLEGSNIQSWTLRKPIDNNKEDQLHGMIDDLAFMITYDLSQSSISAKTWEGFKYYTEALDASNQYMLSGNLDDLYLASNYSLKAIASEKEYKIPFDLLSSLEIRMISIGRADDAIEYCNKTLELDNASAYGWNNKGNALSSSGKYDNAIRAYDEAVRIDPKYVTAWYNKGVAFFAQGKYDKAIQAYDEAIKLDPNFVKAWNNKGIALNNLGKYDEAIRAYDEAIRIDPKYVTAWSNKGNALASSGKYDEAIKAYDEAIRIDPKYVTAWYNKGVAFFAQGKYDKAIQAYDEAIKLDPNFVKAWNNKGIALNNLGKYDEAIKAYDEAIRIDPKYVKAGSNKSNESGKYVLNNSPLDFGTVGLFDRYVSKLTPETAPFIIVSILSAFFASYLLASFYLRKKKGRKD